MKKLLIIVSTLISTQFAVAAPIATAESFGYSGADAAKYNRAVASLASSDCGKLSTVANQASGGDDVAIRQNAARAVAKAKGC